MRRELFYVDVSHLQLADIEFFGYRLILESEEFWLFQCWDGDEQIVQKSRPLLLVDDLNDANALKAFKGFVFTKLDS